ncbi:translation initiation factor IF-3 [Clostridium sediminicola]|uniref:translation initiation factor IF-3 n=1 Tax=Clostridium sediminicola TaxID=3114879 RepID=UPI003D166139
MKKETLLNEEIRFKEVRVVGSEGEQLGIMSSREALRIAEDKDLDLVLIAENGKPPVVKIMDYGKYLYEKTKKIKEAKKNQKVVNLKEIRMSPVTEEHDIMIKANRARKFLTAEDKVKVTVRFRGRQNDYKYKGKEILENFLSKVEDLCVVEKRPTVEGRNMIMIIAPKRA